LSLLRSHSRRLRALCITKRALIKEQLVCAMSLQLFCDTVRRS